MKRKSTFMMVFLTTVMVSSFAAFEVSSIEASGTIYIRADGSIDPEAPIFTVDNITYTLTDNISDSIVVQRDNIIVDGAGYTLQGTGAWDSKGIDLTGTMNITIKNMELTSFWYAIWLGYSSNGVISSNKITNNWHGIWLVESPNNIISRNNITRWDRGIYLSGSSNNTISENSIVNPNYGIWLDYSSNDNHIIENNITDGLRGISLYNSSNNTISENSITNNVLGIRLYSSRNNSISGNNITHWETGICLEDSSSNILSGNKITNTTAYAIRLDYFSSYNRIVRNNIMNNNWDGIYLNGSSSNTISENNMNNNDCAIELYGSSSNTISENNITDNRYGVWIYNHTNNRFFHNNFINNTNQAHVEPNNPNIWDNGYPSGGNYWSDYTDVDQYGGPYQNETGSDGIWDHPYVIDENNRDNYPFALPDTTPTIVITSPENKTYSMNIVPLAFTVDEFPSWTGYSLNGQANATITGNTTLPALPDGWHHVAVYANDTINNMGMNLVYFTIDTTKPNITSVFQDPLSDILPDTTVSINATVIDVTSGLKLVLLNCTFANNTDSWHTTFNMNHLSGNIWNATMLPYPYGTNVTYVIIAEDNAGNTITTEQIYGYKYGYQVIPEFPSFLTPLLFMTPTLLAAIVYRRKHFRATSR